MLDLAFRNIRKQRTRTLLTVMGILIGITAIVALGSFSEGINVMVGKELGDMAGKIIVMQKGSGGIMSMYAGSDITQEQLDNIRSISGVEEAVPMLWFMPGGSGQGFSSSSVFVIGMDVDNIELLIGKNIEMEEGRLFDAGERDVAIAGYDIAESLNLRAGDFFTVKDKEFSITGVAEKTGDSDLDFSIVVPVEDLQDAMDTENYQSVFVVAQKPENAEIVADDIMSQDDTLEALTSKEIARQFSEIMGTVSIFTIGVGAIAAFVGGLGVMNTMIMAVIERKRELGLMKAVGATRRFMLMQILTESSLISIIGGAAGLFLGWLASMALTVLFGGMITTVVTPGLAGGSLAFALALGVFGGLYPAWKAVKLDPVDALRG